MKRHLTLLAVVSEEPLVIGGTTKTIVIGSETPLQHVYSVYGGLNPAPACTMAQVEVYLSALRKRLTTLFHKLDTENAEGR